MYRIRADPLYFTPITMVKLSAYVCTFTPILYVIIKSSSNTKHHRRGVKTPLMMMASFVHSILLAVYRSRTPRLHVLLIHTWSYGKHPLCPEMLSARSSFHRSSFPLQVSCLWPTCKICPLGMQFCYLQSSVPGLNRRNNDELICLKGLTWAHDHAGYGINTIFTFRQFWV